MNGKKTSLFLFIASLLLYGNSLMNGWGMDDNFVLKDNKQVMKGISAIPEIFSTPYYSSPSASFGYRPLTKAMYAVEYSIFGINLPVHHLINIILYALCAVLVLRFLKRYLEKEAGPLFVWVAFSIWFFHPVHTEVVCSLKNREEMMWMIFGFLSIEYIEKYIERSKTIYIIIALVLFALSFLAKQSALSLLPAIPLLLWYRYNSDIKSFLSPENIRIAIACIILILVGYLFYRMTYYLFSKDDLELHYFENPLRYNDNFSAKISLVLMTFLFYVKILVIPHPLVFYYGLYSVPEISLLSAPVIFSTALLTVVMMVFIRGIKHRTAISFGAGFTLLSLLMFSNIPEKVNGIIGERLLFVPSIGFAIFTTALIFIMFRIKKDVTFKTFPSAAKLILLILLVFYTGKTVVRNTTWRDSLILFKNDIRYAGNSVQANSILAGEMMDRMVAELEKGKPASLFKSSSDSIIMLYKRAWILYPGNYRSLNNLGDLYMTFRNNPDTAILFLSGAYKLEPDNFYVNYNIARGFEMKGEYKKALHFYKKASIIKPEKKQAGESIARVEKMMGG